MKSDSTFKTILIVVSVLWFIGYFDRGKHYAPNYESVPVVDYTVCEQ